MGKRSVMGTLGASNHSSTERQTEDFYSTDPSALEALLIFESFNHEVWECACGSGSLSKVLLEHGYDVKNSDIIKRAELPNFEISDFLAYNEINKRDIITNPPYTYVNEFIRHALDISEAGTKIAMILRLTTLEGQSRYNLIFKTDPPKKVYVFTKRVLMSKDDIKPKGSAVAYAWFVWEKGYTGAPEIHWL